MNNFDERSYGIVPVYLESHSPLYLLIQQHQGHWSFPKGNAEEGEDPREAAVREFKEETGIESVKLAKGFEAVDEYWFKRDGQKVHKQATYFLGIVEDTQLAADETEVAATDWLPYSAARKQLTYDEAKKTLKKAKNHLRVRSEKSENG